ncbi:MAG: phosphoribosylanthranilate isomerase [Gemmatimonadales bacterium]|nr:phosphoribosylanthranilate isomerase [Gemmatimonadales bacterium]
MSTPAAKICGLRRPEDAALAAEAGAAYLGVILAAGGPRTVSVAEARAVVAAASGVPVLGVVVREPVAEAIGAARAAGLAGLQLHGAYTAGDARAVAAAGLRAWRVLRLAADAAPPSAEDVAEGEVVLLEPHVPGRDGGTGVALPWPAARAALERVRVLAPRARVALAGGLRPETVAAAIAAVGPDIVDTSSGVEDAPGVKSAAALRRFLEAVHGHRAGR